jgi:hypothetical protein
MTSPHRRVTSLHRTTLTSSRRMVLTCLSSRHINRATGMRVKSLATCRFAHPPGFTLFRADDTFEGLNRLFAGLDNVADEGNIPTERSTTNILDQNLPASTAKPTVNDFGNVTDAVAWMNKHKQCLICGQPRNKPTPLHNINDAQHLSNISFSIMTARRPRICAVGALWQDATLSAS